MNDEASSSIPTRFDLTVSGRHGIGVLPINCASNKHAMYDTICLRKEARVVLGFAMRASTRIGGKGNASGCS